MSFRICNFPKPDGAPCGSPALKNENLCYFHHRDQQRFENLGSAIRRADVLGPRLPRMKSLADVQLALYEVGNAISLNTISTQRAGRILSELDQAAVPFRRPKPSPD